MKKLIRQFWDMRPAALRPLSEAEYKSDLLDDETKAKVAFEKAWEIRNFEIEMYWKRASYFWAFIASAFVGYFALVSSSNYRLQDRFNHAEVFLLSASASFYPLLGY